MNYIFGQAERCKEKIRGLMTDQRVAGYINHEDRADTQYALKNLYGPNAQTVKDQANKKFAQDLLNSLEAEDKRLEQ